MEPQAISDGAHAVEAIVVTGSRTERPLGEAPVATEIISEQDIAESGAQDLAELLEGQPGLYLDRSFAGTSPMLQGLPADYTLILVDGVRVPGRVGGVLDLQRFPIEDIERVEIVRGASSALYGSDAIAGVINVITRTAQRPLELSGSGSVGAYRNIDLSGAAGLHRRRWSTRIAAGRHSGDGFDLDPSDVATSQSAFEQYNVRNQTRLLPNDSFALTVSTEYLRRDREGVDLSGGGAVFDRHNSTETGSILLRPEWDLREGSRLKLWSSLGTFRDQFLLDQRDSDALDERQETRERIGQLGAQLDLLLGSAHLVSIGSEAWHESLDTERLVGGTGDRTRGALYVQDEWTLSEARLLVLLPGARLDLDSQFGLHVTPRAALRFDPISELTFRVSYAWGFKAPDFRELYLLFENPSAGYLVEGSSELEPETSTHLSIGLEYRPRPRVWLSLQGFWNELTDRISTDLVPGDEVGPRRFRYRNIDSARTLGAEASARITPLPGLRLDLSYALAHTRDAASDQPISGQPLHRATLSVRYRAPGVGFETSSRAAIVGNRPFFQDTDGDGASERRDSHAYASVDVRVSQALGYGFRSFVLAENMLDAGDAEFLPLQPRTFSGGASFDY